MVFRQRSYNFIIALNPYSTHQGLIYLRFSDFDLFTLKLTLISMKNKQKECFWGCPENYRLLDISLTFVPKIKIFGTDFHT